MQSIYKLRWVFPIMWIFGLTVKLMALNANAW